MREGRREKREERGERREERLQEKTESSPVARNGGILSRVRLPATRLRPGRYRVTLSLVASVNPGAARIAATPAFAVR